ARGPLARTSRPSCPCRARSWRHPHLKCPQLGGAKGGAESAVRPPAEVAGQLETINHPFAAAAFEVSDKIAVARNLDQQFPNVGMFGWGRQIRDEWEARP